MSGSMKAWILKSGAALLVCALFQGCATHASSPVTAEVRSRMPSMLAGGDLRLNCTSMSCAGSWGAVRKRARGYYEYELWSDLAAEVVSIGYPQDLTYFYLARAAEGMQKVEAAQVYYRLALASRSCNGLFDTCDGIDVRRGAMEGLSRLGVQR